MYSRISGKALVMCIASFFISIALLIPPAMAETGPNDWPSMHGDGSNTYFVLNSIDANLVSKDTPVVNGYQPFAVSNGQLYAVDKREPGKLYAVDLTTNRVKWEFTTEGTENPIHALAVINGTIYAAAAKTLYAIEDNETAAVIKWSRDAVGGLKTFDDSTLYFLDNNFQGEEKKVTAIDINTGAVKWTYPLGKFDQLLYEGKMAAGDGRLFFTLKDAQMQFKMYSLNAATGQAMWTTDLFGNSSGVPVYKDGKVYLDLDQSTYQNPKSFIAALDAETGNILWKYNVIFGKYPHYTLSLNNESVYTTNNEGYLIAIDKNTGVERWKVMYAEVYTAGGRQQNNVSNGPALAAEDKVFLENHGKIKIYDAKTGNFLRSVEIDGFQGKRVSPDAIASGMLFVSDGEKLYTFAPAAPESDPTKPKAAIETVVPQRFSPYENVQSRTELKFWLDKESKTQMIVLREDGQTIRTIELGWVKNGWNTRFWDGKDDLGQMVPYGRYYFGLKLTDLYGNTAYYEDKSKTVVVGDVLGKTLKNSNLRKGPGTGYEIIEVAPAGTELFIQDELADWYEVVRVDNRSAGYISKSLVGTRSNPGGGADTQPVKPSTYTVQVNETLYLIAKKLGVNLDELMKANPAVKPENVYAGLVLNIPQQGAQPGPTPTYTVQANETLYLIAKKLGISLDELMKANPTVKPENVYAGLVLNIPQQGTQPESATTYTVQANETLYLIAKKLGVNLEALMKANPAVKPENVYAGLVLNVPQKQI
ncbi:LysM peptidoglycan-binding domain-containing protein [Paenibacillus tarimensis]